MHYSGIDESCCIFSHFKELLKCFCIAHTNLKKNKILEEIYEIITEARTWANFKNVALFKISQLTNITRLLPNA